MLYSNSTYTLYIVKFFVGLVPCFGPIFVDFRKEAAGLCVNKSTNRDVK